MKNISLISATIVALAVCGGASAGEHQSSKEEAVGVGSGVVVGALAGGPIGAVVGAVAGSLIGDRLHRSEAGRRAALDELGRNEIRLAALRSELGRSQSEVARWIQAAEDARALTAGLRFDVLFHTNESALQPAAETQLTDLIMLLEAYPELRVRLDGHADPRGDSADNDRLAAERAMMVERRLLVAGIPTERVERYAYGERGSRAADGDLDAYAFERRVSVSLQRDDSAALALNRER